HRLVADEVRALGGEELGHARLAGEVAAPLLELRGAQGHQPRGLEARLHVREEPAQRLELADGLAERAPLAGVLRAGLQRRAPDAAGLAGDADAPAVERGHGQLEAAAQLAEQVRGGYLTILKS